MPDVLVGLREPDCVFLGGGGLSVLEAALKVGRPDPRRCRPGRRSSGSGRCWKCLAQQGFSTDGSQLAASRLSLLPDGTHRLAATNPVFVVWGERS